jgi:hypothetical protein
LHRVERYGAGAEYAALPGASQSHNWQYYCSGAYYCALAAA